MLAMLAEISHFRNGKKAALLVRPLNEEEEGDAPKDGRLWRPLNSSSNTTRRFSVPSLPLPNEKTLFPREIPTVHL
jgi:hypothetical protein